MFTVSPDSRVHLVISLVAAFVDFVAKGQWTGLCMRGEGDFVDAVKFTIKSSLVPSSLSSSSLATLIALRIV